LRLAIYPIANSTRIQRASALIGLKFNRTASVTATAHAIEFKCDYSEVTLEDCEINIQPRCSMQLPAFTPATPQQRLFDAEMAVQSRLLRLKFLTIAGKNHPPGVEQHHIIGNF
jgi:hypothetical protein